MGRTTFYLSLAFLFIASVIPSNAQSETSAPAAEGTLVIERTGPQRVFYDVRGNLSLRCTLPNEKGEPYVWKKNNTALDEHLSLKARTKLEENGAVLSIVGRAIEDDYGNYTCAVGDSELALEVLAHPVLRLPPNSNVVEGQTLKIQCKVTGKPYPQVEWLYSNSSDETSNGTAVSKALDGRARVQRSEQGVEGGELVLQEARREDAGRYWCTVKDGPQHSVTTLRVKDMYAALWPFLGICAEVFVLCVIILVYEKRRTKPELDDSDTDNHDQKKS